MSPSGADQALKAALRVKAKQEGFDDLRICRPSDVPEVPEQPVTVQGDVWILGRHRLMCGDSTSIDAVEKLTAGKKAALLHADPPYG
ncbi:MAG: DNA methylase, partial [Paracoccaceae bacterium]